MAFINLKVMTEFFKRVGEYNEDKAMKICHKYLTNDELGKILFDPDDDKLKEVNNQVEELVAQMCKKKALNCVIETLDEYGTSGYPRWTPVFLNTVVNNAVGIATTGMKTIEEALDKGEISKSAGRENAEVFEKIYKRAEQLNKRISKMVKSDAKRLAEESGLPREICKNLMRITPAFSKDAKVKRPLINKRRLNVWLPMHLSVLYENADKFADDIKDIDWKGYFKVNFGIDNIPDIATILLVEGVDRIKNIDSEEVRKVWDSLTAFALSSLEKSESGTRAKMLEIYLKRVTNMFANGTRDLRVDITSLSKKDFPNLTKTIESYTDRIKEAFSTKENK